jgi:hypothetical protein
LSQRSQTELRSTAPHEPPFTANSRLSRPAAARFLPGWVNLGLDSRRLPTTRTRDPGLASDLPPKISPAPLPFSSPMNPHEAMMLQTPDYYYCVLAFSSFKVGKPFAHGAFPSFSVTHDPPGIFCSLHILTPTTPSFMPGTFYSPLFLCLSSALSGYNYPLVIPFEIRLHITFLLR